MNLIDPNIAFDNYYDRTKYKIAKNIAIITCVIFTVFCFLFWEEQTEIIYYYLLSLVISIFCLIYLLFSKNYQLTFYSLSIGATVIVQLAANFGSHSLHYAAFSWTLLASIVAFFGIGKKFGILISLLNILGISYFAIFYLNDHLVFLNANTINQSIGLAVEFSSILILTAYIMYQFVLFYDYSDSHLQKINKDLENKNILISSQYEEKITLVKEIHHRVKNNLQIVVSLLRLQKGELKSDEAKRHFNEAINRIMVMSLIHEKLYQEVEIANIEIKTYLSDLTKDVIHISNMGSPILYEVTSEINKVGLKTVVPLGLLINELLSNSIKHAFHNIKDGFISISIFEKQKDEFILVYSDNGNWVEQKENSSGFGLGLIETLTEQLEGDFKRNNSEYTFTLKNLDN